MVYRGTLILDFMLRPSVRWLALALVALLPIACASAPAETASFTEPVAEAEGPRGPVTVDSIDVRATDNGSELRLTADGPLVWTQYRDDAGNLVVELPNSVAGDAVASTRPGGLISSIDVLSQDNGDRPLTRLVISTAQQAEHTLLVDDRVLSLEFVPTAQGTRVTSAPSTQREPAPAVTETAAAPAAPQRVAESDSQALLAVGTPDAPYVGPAPTGVAATRLEGIEPTFVDGAPGVFVRGDGQFSFSSFQLEQPARFVIDLDGVVNTSSEPTVVLNDGVVRQVRMAQFRPYPEPVSRVVFDLADLGTPQVVRTDEGLLISFGGSPTAVAQAADAEPAVEETFEPEPVEPAPTQIASAPTTPEPAPEPAPLEPEPVVAEAAPEPLPVAETLPAAEEEVAVAELETEPVAAELEPEPAAAEPEMQVAEVTPEPELETEPVAPTPEPVPEPVAEVQIAEATPAAPEPRPLQIEDTTQQEAPTWKPETSDVSLFEAQEVRNDTNSGAQRQNAPASFGVQALGSEKQYYGEPITMSLKDADITEVLRSIARIADLNIVIQPGVNGPVTVELHSVPWDQALEQILKVNNLGQQLEGNILRIAPVSQLQAEAQAEQALREARRLSVPLTTVMRRISYARASEIAQILTQGVRNNLGGVGGQVGAFGDQGILSQRGSVNVDDRTNTLIIQELPDYLDTVLQVIENLDIPEQQVMIEARIIETTRNFSRSLGVNWSFNGVADNTRGNTTGLEFPNNIDANGGVQLLTGGQNGFLNLGLGNVLNTFELDVAISAAESDGLVNVISAPKVATINNEQATIQTGLQIPIQTVANNTVTVQFVNATLRLEVTPQVTAEGTIMMDIDIQKREPQLAFAVVGATNAPIATREASTRVIVRDGGTAVIGGIYEVSTNEGEDRVPGLANIPILGHLFKNKNRSNQNEELLIFITPRVIQL